MRYGLIYRTSFNRSRAMSFDTDKPFAAPTNLDPEQFLVEHLIDFDAKTVIPVALKSDGTLFEIPDGEYGEATPAEYFENMEVEA
jgi:hypothetical protein